jgi:hypothetical protein
MVPYRRGRVPIETAVHPPGGFLRIVDCNRLPSQWLPILGFEEVALSFQTFNVSGHFG